jgi:hypothetical protein
VSALINSIVLPRPSSALVSAVVRALKSLESATRLSGAVIADFGLGKAVKESLPHLKLTASVLMDVHKPVQAGELSGVFDAIVAASRIMRDLKALEDLKKSFPGVLRIITNEGCLPGCLMRSQHFYEMAYSKEFPASLCEPLLAEHPWLRLTGAWVLPQHLHFYSGITSHFKLAGRAALQDPERYLEVLGAYVERRPLAPDAIGGGPASPLSPVSISPDFFLKTLNCDKNCFACHVCRNRYELSAFAPSAAAPASGP